jgi:acetyltransferase-like isoleucine patch superfamily enzyme
MLNGNYLVIKLELVMNHKLLLIVSWIIRIITVLIPDSKFGNRFRGLLYGLFVSGPAKRLEISSNVRLINLENIVFGNDVYLAPGVIINAIEKILFEDEVMLGFNVVVVSGDHTKIDNSYRFGKSKSDRIIFKYGSWVGANSVILKGAIISSGTVIGANSVVKSITEPNSTYIGSHIYKLK